MGRVFSDSEARLIAGRALTLRERLQHPGNLVAGSMGASRRIGEWRKVLGGDEAFASRLADLELVNADELLGDGVLAEGVTLPSWVMVIDRVLGDFSVEDLAWREGDDVMPFHEVSACFVREAWRRVEEAAGSSLELLDTGAAKKLRAGILQWVTALLAPVLETEFVAFRSVRQQLRGGIQILGSLPGVISRDQYRDFVTDLRAGGMKRVCLEFPVLSRLLGRLVEMGAIAEAEFVNHLAADIDRIGEAFQIAPESRRVASLQSGLSDRHHGGRTVKILTFVCGTKVVYKPKPVSLERIFSDFQEWLSRRLTPGFRAMKVLDCDGHGWVEFIDHRPCETRGQASDYFRRAGALVAVIYAFEGTDYHNENLIANGEFPVPIDQEGLFHHRPRMVDSTGRKLNFDLTAENRLAHSVIRTALLPYWRFGEDGRSLDISALGGQFDEESFVKLPKWDHVNTDRMRLVYEHHVSRSVNTNIVRLDGVVQSANDFLVQLEEGFHTGYRALIAERENLLTQGGWIDKFSGQIVRFIYRDTRVYFMLQRHSLSPRFLRSGLDRSVQLEILFRGFLVRPGDPPHTFLRLIASEIDSIEELDIPMFQPRSSEADLELPDGTWIRDCFVETSLQSVRNRIGLLGDQDLALQTRILRGALATRTVRPQQERLSIEAGAWAVFAPLDQSALIEQAIAIAERLEETAVWQNESSSSWVGFVHVVEANRSQLQQLPWRLYDGVLGVAVFLGALSVVWPDSQWAARAGRLARAAIEPMREGMRRMAEKMHPVDSILKDLGLGAGLGAGSLIYGFVHLADWLRDEALIDVAEQLAGGIQEDIIAADLRWDPMFGSAGGVLGLLALHRVRPAGGWLERAVMCGNHLLKNRMASPLGMRAWAEHGQKPLTGMSHGAAGYAYSLFSLASVSGRSEFADAAKEAVAYENSVYRPDQKNWPDFRPPEVDVHPCWCSWCHGAPGILLSRVECLPMHDTAQIRRDIEVATETTLRRSLTPIDHLCCGNLGRADILLTAGLRLGRKDLMDASSSIVSGVVTRARQEGGYRLGNDPDYSPHFFQGLSGIGYTLLRQAFPNKFPSVLSWEPPPQPANSGPVELA